MSEVRVRECICGARLLATPFCGQRGKPRPAQKPKVSQALRGLQAERDELRRQLEAAKSDVATYLAREQAALERIGKYEGEAEKWYRENETHVAEIFELKRKLEAKEQSKPSGLPEERAAPVASPEKASTPVVSRQDDSQDSDACARCLKPECGGKCGEARKDGERT